MLLIAAVADTHVPDRADSVPDALLTALDDRGVDRILHAGDVTEQRVLDRFETIAPVLAVKGNGDVGLELPETVVETFAETAVAMRHRPGTVDLDAFATEHDADIVVHGHTHAATVRDEGAYTVLNPGSPTQPRATEPSYGVIRIDGADVAVELERFTS